MPFSPVPFILIEAFASEYNFPFVGISGYSYTYFILSLTWSIMWLIAHIYALPISLPLSCLPHITWHWGFALCNLGHIDRLWAPPKYQLTLDDHRVVKYNISTQLSYRFPCIYTHIFICSLAVFLFPLRNGPFWKWTALSKPIFTTTRRTYSSVYATIICEMYTRRWT